MSLRVSAVFVVLMLVVGTLLFWFVEKQLSGTWFGFAINIDVIERMESAQADLRKLAEADPGGAAIYRERFEKNQQFINRLRIMEHNRRVIIKRYERLLLITVGAGLLLVGLVFMVRQQRIAARMMKIQTALEELVNGRTDVLVPDRGRDAIGSFARMIERTSAVFSRDRQRLASLSNLKAWQEAARRHAHEIRTPLTAARLELDRLSRLLLECGQAGESAQGAAAEVSQQIERLAAFVRQFGSFARLPEPKLQPIDLGPFVAEFVATFSPVWPGLHLKYAKPPDEAIAMIDRDMIRQVLVNLCENSSKAYGDKGGEVEIIVSADSTPKQSVTIVVSDHGPGIPDDMQGRLFQPYSTSRKIGEGMGLGLAISRKIVLDHGGDLELLRTSTEGTTFKLTFPGRNGE